MGLTWGQQQVKKATEKRLHDVAERTAQNDPVAVARSVRIVSAAARANTLPPDEGSSRMAGAVTAWAEKNARRLPALTDAEAAEAGRLAARLGDEAAS